jgi:hypothetical protein
MNPGNIRKSATRYLGEVVPSRDKAFKQFQTMVWGYRAMFVLLDSYRRKGYLTIRQMVTRYAPPIENHTENYIRYVSEWSGVGVDVPLDTQSDKVMIPVVAAMSRIENGIPAVLADVDAGWNLYQTHKP